jgi:hypothetical protein
MGGRKGAGIGTNACYSRPFGEVRLGVVQSRELHPKRKLCSGFCSPRWCELRQALHKGNAKLRSKLVAGFELNTVAGFHNWVSTHQ